MGTGLLTLPYSMVCLGIVPTLVLISFFGLVMALTMYTYVKTAHNDGSTSLAMLAGTNLGPAVKRAMEVIMMFYCLFSCVGCFIVLADITKEPVEYFICNGTPCIWTERYILQSFAGILMLPPLFLREITSLQFSAILGIASILFIAVVIILRGSEKFSANWDKAWDSNANNLNHWGALYGIPNICLSYQCQIQTIEVYSELKPKIRSVKLMMCAVATAVTLEVIVYSAAALFGFVTFLGETPTNILSANYGGSDILVEVARMCVMVVMIVQFPVNHFPARSAVWELYSALSARICKPSPRGATAKATTEGAWPEAQVATSVEGAGGSGDEHYAFQDDEGSDVPGQLYNVSEDGYAGELDESAPSTPAMRRLFSPALSHPASDVPASAVTRKQNSKIPGCFFVVESVVWWIVCLGLGIVIPDLTVLFDILGFTMAMIIIFYIPALTLCKNTSSLAQGRRGRYLLYRILVVVFWIVGALTTVISAFNFVANVFIGLNETAGEPGVNASMATFLGGGHLSWIPLLEL
eukprot:INCI12376.1.p1 GENE.INCI12376.1~~INCI12376.1.p1  ORF type:complete len:614 (-),score=70.82 INCI12376.1:223-1797(-)